MTTLPALDDGEPMRVADAWLQWTRHDVVYFRPQAFGPIYASAADRVHVFLYHINEHTWQAFGTPHHDA